MEILNSLRYKAIAFLVSVVCTNAFGLNHNPQAINSIRITYNYINGYAVYRSVAIYALNNNTYVLQKGIDTTHIQYLPEIIEWNKVSKLLNDYILYVKEDICDGLKITHDDYSNYIKALDDSIYNYLPFMQNIKKEQYKLNEDTFLSLSCDEILNIIESPNNLFSSFKPLLNLELAYENGEIISIEPKWYFEGTTWSVVKNGQEIFLDNKYVMSFLRDICFDKYAIFGERFYLLFQIADNIKGAIPVNHK